MKRPIDIYNQIAVFLVEEHLLKPEEKLRFLECVREDAKSWQRQ